MCRLSLHIRYEAWVEAFCRSGTKRFYDVAAEPRTFIPIPKRIARFNRYVTNPIARRIAGWAPMFAIVHHRGRRSGRRFSTPVNIFPSADGFVVALTYGSDVDWVKNLTAAGGGEIKHRTRTIGITEPVLIPTEEGMAAMPRVVKLILRMINVTEFLRVKRSR
jgi:deazaflavin-dependent oxidoreductase (nitroreductase family)